MHAELPALVYCSITGFGQTGPNAHLPGYDLLAQGYGGVMSLTGAPDGEPMKVGVAVADVMCGMYAATAILAALRHRDRTGMGQQIDIALVDSQVAWLVNAGTQTLATGEAPGRFGNEHPTIVPYQVFAAADGHVIVAVGNDAQFARFCALIDQPGLALDPRFRTNTDRLAHRELLVGSIASRLRELPAAEILARMAAGGVPGGPIHTLPQVFASEQVAAREMVVSMAHPATGGVVALLGNPIKMSETPVTYRRAPPACGEHTAEVLAELLSPGAARST
jgi:crotonobetainyl-CoA:carnitine CoA-transferase CaiB-like acyl-CoA transferase